MKKFKSRITSVDCDPKGLVQMIVSSFNLRDTQNVKSVKVPLGLAGDAVISVVVEPNIESWSGNSLDIPYSLRDEALGKMKDTIILHVKPKESQ